MCESLKVDTGEETFADVVKRMRAALPTGHPDLKSFAEIAREQGVGPFDTKRARALAPGPIYEGFEEDVRRMRRGLQPIGPRE